MANSRIMEKIAALLAKTVENGASESEAIEAAKAAQRLMKKYQIEAVEFTEKTEEVGDDSKDITRNWQAILAKVIADNTCCRVVRSNHPYKARKKIVMFFGRESDRKSALQMWEMFYALIQNGIKKAKRITASNFGHSRNVEAAYATRYIQAIREELGAQCRALVLVVPEEVDEAVSKKFPRLRNMTVRTRIDSVSRMAGEMGYKDGKEAAGRKRIA